jgi:hypothetical protein
MRSKPHVPHTASPSKQTVQLRAFFVGMKLPVQQKCSALHGQGSAGQSLAVYSATSAATISWHSHQHNAVHFAATSTPTAFRAQLQYVMTGPYTCAARSCICCMATPAAQLVRLAHATLAHSLLHALSSVPCSMCCTSAVATQACHRLLAPQTLPCRRAPVLPAAAPGGSMPKMACRSDAAMPSNSSSVTVHISPSAHI